MHKKKLLGLACAIAMLTGLSMLWVAIFTYRIRKNTVDAGDITPTINHTEGTKVNGKILVAYYSAQNHTKAIAEEIANNLGADIFEIVPQETYTSEDLDWTDENSRVSHEHNDESLRNVVLVQATPDNWDIHNTVLIGYPIWWGIAAWPVDSFVKVNDFAGKTVIPFATSASSGLGQSGELLEQMANGGTWQTGKRFSSNASSAEIKSWTDELVK